VARRSEENRGSPISSANRERQVTSARPARVGRDNAERRRSRLMTDTSRRRPTAVRKQEIARIAARLFAAQGFHGTGINELAQEVGLGKGALYYHIKSKEDLLFEISTAHVH
jgi:AcrR family transcriptional regulator